jgi:hypothetical protein
MPENNAAVVDEALNSVYAASGRLTLIAVSKRGLTPRALAEVCDQLDHASKSLRALIPEAPRKRRSLKP